MRQERDDGMDARALVQTARAGDAQAFRRLVEMHMRAVHAIAFRMLGNHDDADDAAQETFVRAWEALERYDPAFSVYTWLRTIATRLCLNELEKRKRRRTDGTAALEAVADSLPGPPEDPPGEIDAARTRVAVLAAMQALPADARAVLVLRVFEDLSYEQIAATLQIPVGTVMSRLSRARAQLRAALAAGMPGQGAPARRRERPPEGVGS
jgi:RNA polymerase sigma-70 factor (ECF subfamily)